MSAGSRYRRLPIARGSRLSGFPYLNNEPVARGHEDARVYRVG